LSSESDIWLLVDRNVLAAADWRVRATPGLIADPAVQPAAPELPDWYSEEAVPSAPWLRRRRRRGPLLVVAFVGLVVLAGASVAALVMGELPAVGDEAVAPPRTVPEEPAPPPIEQRVLAGMDGEPFTCTKVGSPGDDELEATKGDDVLCGLGGADTISAGEGNDVLLGGAGRDTLVGGPGKDQLDGGPGRDSIEARDGFRDRIRGGPGRDEADVGWLDEDVVGVETRGDPIVVAAGDIACDPRTESFEGGAGTETRCRQRYTAALVEEIEPDAVLVLGDVQYEDGRRAAYRRSYDETWGAFKAISRPSPGGAHDTFGGGYYGRYWKGRVGPQGRLYYSFDVGAWHVVSLNTNCGRAGGCDPGSAQEQWLRADLAANDTACTLAFMHEPLFSSGEPLSPSLVPLWQALYDSGAEIILAGDSHTYERFRPLTPQGVRDPAQGIRSFVVGTGGRSLERFERRAPGSAVRQSKTFGVLQLRLRPASYEWEFVAEPRHRFRDASSSECH
jgi:hypothetical protein